MSRVVNENKLTVDDIYHSISVLKDNLEENGILNQNDEIYDNLEDVFNNVETLLKVINNISEDMLNLKCENQVNKHKSDFKSYKLDNDISFNYDKLDVFDFVDINRYFKPENNINLLNNHYYKVYFGYNDETKHLIINSEDNIIFFNQSKNKVFINENKLIKKMKKAFFIEDVIK